MLAIDAGDLVVPLMFDLSSTSDTIVDEILIGRLEHCDVFWRSPAVDEVLSHRQVFQSLIQVLPPEVESSSGVSSGQD